MRRRPKRTSYAIKLPHLKHTHTVSAAWFAIYLEARLIARDVRESRLGRVVDGFTAWIDHDGRLQFQNLKPSAGASIPSSWRWVERALQLGLIGENISPQQLAANLRAEYAITG